MSAKLTLLNAPQKALPADLPQALRNLASRVECGEVTEMVIAYVAGDEYEYMFPSSLTESLLLATLLQARCIDRYRT
jgi:hypothetical protein